MVQQVKYLALSLGSAGSIPYPAQWVKGSGVAPSCGIGHSCGSDSVPSPGTSICHRCGKKKRKEKKKLPALEFPGGPVVKDLVLSLLQVEAVTWL